MKIIFINHQENSLGYSMLRYENILSKGMRNRGHHVEIWGPKLYFSNGVDFPTGFRKWLRYIDRYLIFPLFFKIKSKKLPKDTLFVLIDQALGIWTPLIQHKKHLVHCHDFIALKSAMGQIKQNPISWTGKIYQRLILKGFSKAKYFVSVSKNTQVELEQFLNKKPLISRQVYNAVDSIFKVGSSVEARFEIGNYLQLDLESGYILHVGGNTFYKNRVGVIELYTAWRNMSSRVLPLLMIGSAPTPHLEQLYDASPYKKDIHFLVRVDDDLLVKAYQGASVFVFPSLDEGFGFPIAEALTVGCPVITTDNAPMNEVGGTVAKYIKRCPDEQGLHIWAKESAPVLETVLQYSEDELDCLRRISIVSAERFNKEKILDQLEQIYKVVVTNNSH